MKNNKTNTKRKIKGEQWGKTELIAKFWDIFSIICFLPKYPRMWHCQCWFPALKQFFILSKHSIDTEVHGANHGKYNVQHYMKSRKLWFSQDDWIKVRLSKNWHFLCFEFLVCNLEIFLLTYILWSVYIKNLIK